MSGRLNQDAATIAALYEQAKRYRAEYVDPLDAEAVRYLWGDQDIKRITEDSQNDFVENLVWQDYGMLLSMLARDTPRPSITGLFPATRNNASQVEHLVNEVWTQNEMLSRTTDLVSFGIPFRRAYFKTTWDRTMRSGLGGIRIEVPDTRDIFFMPGIGKLSKSLVVFERMRVDKMTAIYLYPKQMAAINELFKIEENDDQSVADQSRDIAYGINEDGMNSTWFLSNGIRGKNEKRSVELVQGWFIDTTVLGQIPELFDEVKNSQWFQKLASEEQRAVENKRLYPRGRLIVFGGKHKFEDRPNPFPSFPYCEYRNLTVPGWKPGDELGMGEFANLYEIQDMLNVRNNQIMDAMDRTPFGGFGLAGRGAHIDIEEITSEARLIYQCNDPNGFKWQPIAPIPAEAFRSTSDMRASYEAISGRHSILQGKVPGDIRSGSGVAELSSLANATVVPRNHALESALRSQVRYTIYMIGAFYEPGVHYSEEMDLQGISPDGYSISVKAGLNLPASAYEIRNIAMALHERQIIDDEDLLNILDFPNKEVLVEKARARRAQMETATPVQGTVVPMNQQGAQR